MRELKNLFQADQTHKARLITQNPVVIVWTEGKIEDYQPEFGRGNIVHIVIHPVFVHVTHKYALSLLFILYFFGFILYFFGLTLKPL